MIAIIGDIHGCFHTLSELVQKIRLKYSSIGIYSVGDLVDRGNFSYEVVEFVQREKIKFTPGNHDYMFYYFMHFPTTDMGRAWIHNGSDTTLDSYSSKIEEMKKHLDFIISAPLFINHDDCFISHAGISNYYKTKLSRKPLDNTDKIESVMRASLNNEHGILWTRDQLLNIGKLQLVGHTRHPEVTFLEKNNVAYIDTSVYTGNGLSAVIVENSKILDTIFVPTKSIDISK
jgi:serine/threonine protein phosphatase 1